MLAVGSAIRAHAGTKPNRPGIVLRLFDVDSVTWVFVATGTSVPPPPDIRPAPVFIDRSHPAFAPLGLDVPTWFKAQGGARLRADDPSIRLVGTCPADVLIHVRELFGFR